MIVSDFVNIYHRGATNFGTWCNSGSASGVINSSSCCCGFFLRNRH